MNSTLEVPRLPSPSIHAVIGWYKQVEIALKLIYTLMGSFCAHYVNVLLLSLLYCKVLCRARVCRTIINFNQVLAHTDTFCSYVTGVTLKVLLGCNSLNTSLRDLVYVSILLLK